MSNTARGMIMQMCRYCTDDSYIAACVSAYYSTNHKTSDVTKIRKSMPVGEDAQVKYKVAKEIANAKDCASANQDAVYSAAAHGSAMLLDALLRFYEKRKRDVFIHSPSEDRC